MRDRLIELIANNVCSRYRKDTCLTKWSRGCSECEGPWGFEIGKLADYLLENGVVVPPCKAGDTVYVLTFDSPTGIEKSRAKRLQIIERDDGTTVKIIVPCVFDDWGDAFRVFFPEDFGKTVFLTKEQAEKALAEVANDT